MARYTCSYLVGLSEKDMITSIKDILKECDLNLTYETGGYVMAKEKPGNVSFTKLVELEILFDRNKKHEGKIQVDFVVKNEELPLQTDNHCHDVFHIIQKAVNSKNTWELETETLND